MSSLILIALLLPAPNARAGSYVGAYADYVSKAPSQYSGGTHYTSTGQDAYGQATFNDVPDSLYTDGNSRQAYGGGGSSTLPNGTKADCSGPIQTSWNWVPDKDKTMTSDPPPSEVIIVQACTASVTVERSGGTGSYATGLGRSGTVGFNPPASLMGSATDTEYQVLPGGAAVSLPVLDAKATVTNAPSSASLSYTASISPLYVQPSGQNSANQALTGQQIEGTMVGLSGLKVTSYTWGFTGATKPNPIKNWDGTNNTQQLFPLLPADLTQTDTTGNGLGSVSLILFYDQVADQKFIITCAVSFTFPDGTAGSVNATSLVVTFVKPTVTWTVNTSYNNIVPGFYTDYPNQEFGAREPWGPITIVEPPALVPKGPGTGCVVQIAKLIRGFARTPLNGQPANFTKLSVVNGDATTSTVAGPTGLDVAFPYPFGYVPNADGSFTASSGTYTWAANTKGYAVDVPFASFTLTVNDNGGNKWYSSTTNDSFNTWVMYRPPANGLGVIYVPLQTLNWSWGGNASLTGKAWTVSQGPSFIPGSPGNTSTPPAWSLYIPYGFSIGP